MITEHEDVGGNHAIGKPPRSYDLAERTARFGEKTIEFARTIKLDVVTRPLINQMVRAGTSVGANYCEANEAGSRKEFRYRISVCNREVQETKHWLRMIAVASPSHKDASRTLWKEGHELNLIFASIFRKTAGKERRNDQGSMFNVQKSDMPAVPSLEH